MTTSSKGPGKKARIEIIPLIDIMFFLLASFMLVSMSMIKLQKVDTHLPAAKSGASQQKQDFVVVGIDAKGQLYYGKDKDPITIDAVSSRLLEEYKEHKDDTKVFVNCDKEATYNQLIGVLDAVRTIGIKQVNFAVQKDKTVGPGNS